MLPEHAYLINHANQYMTLISSAKQLQEPYSDTYWYLQDLQNYLYQHWPEGIIWQGGTVYDRIGATCEQLYLICWRLVDDIKRAGISTHDRDYDNLFDWGYPGVANDVWSSPFRDSQYFDRMQLIQLLFRGHVPLGFKGYNWETWIAELFDSETSWM